MNVVKTDNMNKAVQYIRLNDPALFLRIQHQLENQTTNQQISQLETVHLISKNLLHFRTVTLKLRAVETVASGEPELESRPSSTSP